MYQYFSEKFKQLLIKCKELEEEIHDHDRDLRGFEQLFSNGTISQEIMRPEDLEIIEKYKEEYKAKISLLVYNNSLLYGFIFF